MRIINKDILFDCNMFYASEEIIKSDRLKLIRNAFKYHYEVNIEYRKICEKNNVDPDSISNYSDLIKIPLIPMSTFKDKEIRERILSVSLDDCLMKIESSGTDGIASVAHKDKITAIRDTKSLAILYMEFLVEIFGGFGMLFILPNKYLPKLGIMKMITMFQLYLNGFEFVINCPTDPPDFAIVMKKLLDLKGKHTRHLIGAPYLIYDFAVFMKRHYPKQKISLDPKSLIITIGGWKRRKGRDVCERVEFNQLMRDIFDISNQQIRDLFAQAESNIFIMECKYQKKHIPPWAYFSIRDFINPRLIEMPKGEEGMIGIFDPINNTFPGFIISGDVGVIPFEGRCKCGRYGQILEFKRRATGVEVRSCALHMDEFIDKEKDHI
ncbi:MAG: hypothetical protein ACMUIM_07890 [bacterium]